MAQRGAANDRKRPEPRSQRGPRGGLGWLFLFAAGGVILALFIFVPDLPKQIFGSSAIPRHLGDEPIATQDQEAQLSSRQVAIEGRSLSGDATDLASRPVKREPEVVDAPIQQPEVETFRDAQRGQDILSRAETAYAAYQWDEARSLANSLRGLDLPPDVRLRAEDIIEGTARLAKLFEVLGTREELVRNLETHPSLVQLQMRGRPSRALPLSDMASKTPVEVADPVSYVQQRLSENGELTVLFENNIASVVKAADVSAVESADVESLIAERRAIMERRVAEFERDAELRSDPMAWYEAAKYAYRNRIDDRVVDMLDRALLLSPDLGQTIREDAAQDWFTKMVMAMEGGNRNAAVGFMRQIQAYEDTLVYNQARAYFDGNLAALRSAREEALAKRQQQQEAARQRRLERATARGDEEALTQVKQEIKQEVAQEESRITAAPAGGGDLASANASFDKGMAIYQEAQSMGATPQRDAKYKEARKYFLAAVAVYADAVDRGDTSVEARMTQANQLQYACMKYARAFSN